MPWKIYVFFETMYKLRAVCSSDPNPFTIGTWMSCTLFSKQITAERVKVEAERDALKDALKSSNQGEQAKLLQQGELVAEIGRLKQHEHEMGQEVARLQINLKEQQLTNSICPF